jgi:phosphonopyruvate decarboxylase
LISAKQLIEILDQHHMDFFCGVPDSLLKDLSLELNSLAPEQNIIAANEGTAMGIAAGYHLATGKIPVVYLQNSGFGHLINPLLSLFSVKSYHLPALIFMGWRGQPDEHDEPQHRHQGLATPEILKAIGLNYSILDMGSADKLEQTIGDISCQIQTDKNCHFMLVRKGVFAPSSKKIAPNHKEISFEFAVESILDCVGSEYKIVGSTGYISRMIYHLRERNGQSHHHDFLNVGAMGHASQIALGIAKFGRRKTVCLEGDGSFLMHMGGAAIIGSSNCLPLYHIVLNNGCHASVGGQPTVGFKINIPEIARACGYSTAISVSTVMNLKQRLAEFFNSQGPALLEIQIQNTHLVEMGRPNDDLVSLKKMFIHHFYD